MNRKLSAPSSCPEPRRAEAGFTLVELLVSLAVTAVLILGVLATFDFSARANRVQMNVADMQQSLRIAQNEIVKLSRMAGRGTLPAAMAVNVRNNVAANTRLISGEDSTLVLEGTDILTLRGVFNSSLYQVDYLNSDVWQAPDADGNGSVVVLPMAAGVPQDLEALDKVLEEAEKKGKRETVVLVTPFDIVAVAEVVSRGERTISGGITGLQLNFTRAAAAEAALAAPLSPGLPAVAHVGILEEHVFYVRAGAAGTGTSLARARMEPGTGLPYDGDTSNATLDIADNIADLQVAVGFGVVGAPEMRVTTLARTDRADAGKYQAPLLPALIEDHAYAPTHAFNSIAQRRYRWRLMRTNVNLRNL